MKTYITILIALICSEFWIRTSQVYEALYPKDAQKLTTSIVVILISLSAGALIDHFNTPKTK